MPNESQASSFKVALVGNPNCGKTTLFNALTGLRAKVANYPGITVDFREADVQLSADSGSRDFTLVDLPGQYGLLPTSPEETVATEAVRDQNQVHPNGLLIVLEAANLERSLFLTSELLELGKPAVVAINMIDEAQAAGVAIDTSEIEAELGCPVVAISARNGFGLVKLTAALIEMGDASVKKSEVPIPPTRPSRCQMACAGCTCAGRHNWASSLTQLSVTGQSKKQQTISPLDRFLTSPFGGLASLAAIMLLVFFMIFSIADVPMSLIENAFGLIAGAIDSVLPVNPAPILGRAVAIVTAGIFSVAVMWLGNFNWSARNLTIAAIVSIAVTALSWEDFRSLVIDGVIGGVAGVVVFLPQICILFFFITLLEDSGYMARGAFVMERVMRRVGLPGKAFVPMLSAHACAIPGIMATRTIENWRDRLVTILVLPLLTCSARLPVYAMVAALLFGGRPELAALMFGAAYCLGLVAALMTAFCLKSTFIKGEAAPLVIELPPYRVPSLKNALFTVVDRASVFLRKAGSVILLISIALWFLATFPKLPTDAPIFTDSSASAQLVAQQELEYSMAGRLGKLFEPVFSPLGFDWKINVGVISSFAAREVIVSTLSIIYGLGEEGADDEQGLVETLRSQTHADGTAVFDTATCLSLLVFYVLAMQCLPTQAVTRRETGSWYWALFQLCYMTALAYVCSLATYQIVSFFGA